MKRLAIAALLALGACSFVERHPVVDVVADVTIAAAATTCIVVCPNDIEKGAAIGVDAIAVMPMIAFAVLVIALSNWRLH